MNLFKRILLTAFFALNVLYTPAYATKPTIDYVTTTTTATYATAQTGTAIWTPASGNRFVLQGGIVSSTNAITIRFQVSGVDVVAPIILTSSGTQPFGGGFAPIYVSAKNAVLTITTVGNNAGNDTGTVAVTLYGYEEAQG